MTAALAVDQLPDSLREIGEALGMEAALAMLDKFAGIRLFIPKRIGTEHLLTKALGQEVAQHLSREFGGETLSIPRAARARRQVRNREIIRRYDGGESVRTLAGVYKLTERQLYTILSGTTA